MRMHSVYVFTCVCGRRHEVEETRFVCGCGREQEVHWKGEGGNGGKVKTVTEEYEKGEGREK